jgi:hypothetical protein
MLQRLFTVCHGDESHCSHLSGYPGAVIVAVFPYLGNLCHAAVLYCFCSVTLLIRTASEMDVQIT